MKKLILFFVLSFILVILTLWYQHATGPTYDKEAVVNIAENEIHIELPRSHEIDTQSQIVIPVADTAVKAVVYYKRFPTRDEYTPVEMVRYGDTLKADLPNQPPAGKLKYYVEVYSADQRIAIHKDDPVIIRYKGPVPVWVLRAHIFFMFASMWLSNLSGLLALAKDYRYKFYGVLTLVSLFIGGLILGPIVQDYAFGVLWSGVPFGWDLTDNKLLLSFLIWLVAVLANLRKDRRFISVIAAILLILMYAIPHSTMGSEFDYDKGEVVTGE